MNQKELFRLIDKYRSYKRFIKSDSLTATTHYLEQSPKFGYQRVILEKEILCWGLISKVNNLTKLLPETERQFVKSVLSINAYEKVSTSQIAKEAGISVYRVNQLLTQVLSVMNQFKA